MTDTTVNGSWDAVQGTAAANLLALAANMEVVKRLLSRHHRDDALTQADAALIEVTIDTARAEARRVGEALGGLPADSTSTRQAGAVALRTAVTDLDTVLDALATALQSLSR